MKISIALLLGVVCLAQAMHMPTKTAEIQQLKQQKSIYDLLWHVDQPNICHPELLQTAKTYKIEDNMDSFTNKDAVNEYLELIKKGAMLPRGEVFSILNPKHKKEAVCLFRLLHATKDPESLHKCATWARFNVNEQMFIYVMSVIALHCPETANMPYFAFQEIIPHLFFNEDVLHKAQQISMGNTNAGTKKTIDGMDVYTITATNKAWNLNNDKFPEQKINYFTEDVGLNTNYFVTQHQFPFWMKSKEYNLPTNIRGELYLFQYKQLLNRYNLERLSNGLDEIDYINLNEPVTSGYYPMMQHYNGMPFPQRPPNTKIPKQAFKDVQTLHDIKTRISNAIDKGYVITENDEKINIYNEEGLNILGNIIQGNADSVNPKYYGQMDTLYKKILSQTSLLTTKNGDMVPTALDIFSTNLRDPAFYQMAKTILTHLFKYKENLQTYKPEELLFPGVKIESFTTDKLTTYFEEFESVVNNLVAVHNHEDAESKLIKVRQHVLKHKPFDYHLMVNSDKDVKATVRIFIGPKYNTNGKEMDLTENFMDYMQMDQWTVDLKTGNNKIERSCHDTVFGVQDMTSTVPTYKKMMKALNDGESFDYTPRDAGFPERTMLPKGKKDGMPFKFFVSITEFDNNKVVEIPVQIWGPEVTDGQAMGYPLDRPLDTNDFKMMPNFMHTDALIYHKTAEEMNIKTIS